MKFWQICALCALICLTSIKQTEQLEWSFFTTSTGAPKQDDDAKHYLNEEDELIQNGTELIAKDDDMIPQPYGGNEGVSIQNIDSLGEPDRDTQGYGMVGSNANTYNTLPQNSRFLDTDQHPTESRGPDPRFQAERACQEGQYLCRKASPEQTHVRCIPNEWKCNGVRDCEENDDEEGCSISPHRVMNACTAHQHTCFGTGINGIPAQCIDRNRVCDNIYDCTYGDDERNCADRARPDDNSQTVPDQYDPYGRPTGQSQPQEPTAPGQQPYYTSSSNSAAAASRYPGQPQASQYPGPSPPGYQPTLVPDCPTSTRSEEYVKRLEWRDRCYRSCMKN